MNLPSFQVQAKNISPDKQMALMRQYLNQLKDDTETELYDIKWDNLSKPLRDKLNSLESYAETAEQQINQIHANFITADVIEANYVKTSVLETQYLTATYLNALNIQAASVQSNWVYAGTLAASQITSGRIGTAHLDASVITTNTLTADMIVGKFVASNTAIFNTINIVQKANLKTGLRITDSNGQTFIDVMLEPYGSGYVLFINSLP